MKKETRILGAILLVLLPILIEGACQYFPESSYCRKTEFYFKHSEPVPQNISRVVSRLGPHAISALGTVTTSGTAAA